MAMRRRFWTEVSLGAASLVLLVLTATWPGWIEALLGVDPDGGDGSLEWALVVALATLAVMFPWLARREWRRAQAADSTLPS
jgi:hypothetical protein